MTVMRTPEQELARFRGRLAVAGVVALVCFGLLAARFFYLQVMRYDYYSTRAEDNRISLVPIVPNRGLITDRHGTVLARNYSAYTLEITPSRVADLDATIEELSTLVDIQPKDRRRRSPRGSAWQTPAAAAGSGWPGCRRRRPGRAGTRP